jgi:PAS domain S-box-containing protein
MRGSRATDPSYILRLLPLVAAYFMAGRFGLAVDAVGGFAAHVWPPTGISLAALLIWGPHFWPGVALGAFLVNFTLGAPLPVALGICAGNALEAWVGVWLLRRVGFRGSLPRVRDVFALVLLGGGMSSLISATGGVLSLGLAGIVPLARVGVTWRAWWVGDLLGTLVVTPLLLLGREGLRVRLSLSRWLEAGALLGAVVALLMGIFESDGAWTPGTRAALPFGLFPLVLWAALRFGQRASVSLTFLVSAVAVAATARGQGPFAHGNVSESLFALDFYIGTLCVTGLTLATAILESHEATQAAQEARWRAEAARQRLLAQFSVGRQLGLGVDPDSTLPGVMQVIGESLGWSVGVYWEVDRVTGNLRPWHVWKAAGVVATNFVEATLAHRFASGEGFPGQVWASRAPAWLADVTKDSTLPRARFAMRDGLRGGVGFPVLGAGREVRAVIEFLSHECLPVDEDMLRTLTTLGGQIGEFLRRTHEATERQRVSEALRQSEQQLRLITDSVPAQIAYIDANQRYLFANASYERWFGKAPAEVIGQTVREVLGENAFARVRPYIERTLAGEAVAFEDVIPYAIGGDRAVYATYTPYRDEQGRIRGFFTLVNDVTEQKNAERTLHEERTRLRLALGHAGLGAWDWDIAGRRVTWDETTQKLFGFAPGTFPGTPEAFEAALHPEDRDRTGRAIAECFKHRTLYDIEYRAVWPDGSVHWIQAKGRAMFNDHGRAYRMLGTVLETTKRKEDEQALRAAISARDEFLSIASHELKTPLTSLKLQSQALLRSVERGDPQAYAKERIDQLAVQTHRQVSGLTRLVDDMLDMARIRTGKLDLRRERTDLGEVAREVLGRLQPQIVAGCGCPATLVCRGPVDGNWDRFRLEQVLTNLLTNALRYGRGQPIELRLEGEPEEVTLSVRDHGMGIAEHNRQRIFDRFERAVPANGISGLGLGLFITRQIVENHGGRIWVESELLQGSTFFVVLPR